MWPFAPSSLCSAYRSIWARCSPPAATNSSSVMMPPANQLARAAAMIRRIGHEIHFIAVFGPRSPHRSRQLPVGQHCRPSVLRPRADDGRGFRFSLETAMRSGDGHRKLDPGSWGSYQLISHAALAAMALARRWSPLDLKVPRTELRSIDWFVSCGSCRPPALSEWPFPLDEGGEVTTNTTELGGLLQDSISRVPAPVI